ncbi:nucleotide-binding protein [Gammaproteobacteria bacterium SCGC AG-212-F23]|nr:nucleotide-binding protein [Gammaproteobacteria bacterium SCGC AG-212-F23]
MSFDALVLDANILIRAVLGKRVRDLIMTYSESVEFFIPDICVEDANKYLPILFKKRDIPVELALEVFSNIKRMLQVIDKNIYQTYATEAQERMKNRDVYDWPVVATALIFNCPIWTEDQDFFGSGIPIWTTDRIHIFFEAVINEFVEVD